MESKEIRLEIAKVAIAAGMTQDQAQEWLEWVLKENDVFSSLDLGGDEFDKLESQLYDGFGRSHITWGDVLRGLLYDENLVLKQAIGCAVMYGVAKSKARDLIVKAIDAGEIAGHYNQTVAKDGIYAHTGFAIKRHSLLSWLNASYTLRIGGRIEEIIKEIIKQHSV